MCCAQYFDNNAVARSNETHCNMVGPSFNEVFDEAYCNAENDAYTALSNYMPVCIAATKSVFFCYRVRYFVIALNSVSVDNCFKSNSKRLVL